jgi:hypothetical protein
MARGRWRREPTTGLPYRLFERIDEAQLAEDGGVPVAYRGSDWRWHTGSAMAELTNLRRPDRLVAAVESDPTYPWQTLTAENGRVFARGTCVSSLAAWAASYTATTAAVRLSNLKRAK